MRKTLSIFAVLALAAWSGSAAASLDVFACEPEWGALARTLGGDDVDVYDATTGLQDPHQIQARPSLIAHARRADLMVCTGAQLEIGWLPILLRQAGNGRIQPGTDGYFEAAGFVRMLEVPSNVDRAQGDIHPAGNPHIQTDPRNIARVAKALTERLKVLDRKHAEDYESRYDDFARRWTQAIAGWQQRAAPLKGAPVVVYHKGWIYMMDWLGMREVATLEPKPSIPPSAGHLADVLEDLSRHPAKMVIYAAYQDGRPAEWLSDHAHVPVVKLPFTVGGTDAAGDLFALFDDTVNRLLAALKTTAAS